MCGEKKRKGEKKEGRKEKERKEEASYSHRL